MSTETALTFAERAAIAIGAPAYEIALVDLVKESASLVQIKDKSGYQQAHSARMRLKGTRVEIQKRAKDAREDAQAFSKAVIAEEKRLIALVEPEEDRLQGLQDVWDAARDAALHAATMGTDGIQGLIVEIEQYDVSEAVFEEFATGARVVRDDTLATLRQLHTAALAREAEAARLRAEREELERLRAEQERIAAEERAKVAAAQQAERDRLAAERAERERLEAEERARVAEAQRIEAERLAEERRKFEEEQRLVREKRAAEERQAAEARAAEEARIAAERAELQRQQDAIAAEQRRQQEAAEAKARAEREAEAERLRQIEDEKRRQADAATARTRTIRSEIDALLDCMSDDQLYAVRDFAANVNRRAAA